MYASDSEAHSLDMIAVSGLSWIAKATIAHIAVDIAADRLHIALMTGGHNEQEEGGKRNAQRRTGQT